MEIRIFFAALAALPCADTHSEEFRDGETCPAPVGVQPSQYTYVLSDASLISIFAFALESIPMKRGAKPPKPETLYTSAYCTESEVGRGTVCVFWRIGWPTDEGLTAVSAGYDRAALFGLYQISLTVTNGWYFSDGAQSHGVESA